MAEEPTAKVFPRGLEDEFPDGPPTVVVTHRGLHFVLRFAMGDLAGKGELRKLEVLPAEGEVLKPRELRRFAPSSEVYVQYARAQMRWLGAGPLDEADPETDLRQRYANIHGAVEALREVGGPGRGYPPEFFRSVAREYEAIVAEGEPHPIKTIAERHHVTISAASRWVTTARNRRLIPKKKVRSDA